MGVRINGLRETKAAFDRFLSDLSFEEKSLNQEITRAYVDDTQKRANRQQAPEGGTWANNEEQYRRWKEKNFHETRVGFLTAQMISPKSLLGTVLIKSKSIEIIYGTGERTTRYADGQTVTDRMPTDWEKAEWFEDGTGRQKPRKLLGLDDPMISKFVRLIMLHIDRKLYERGLA